MLNALVAKEASLLGDARSFLEQTLGDLPDNRKVTRLAENVFLIKRSDLEDNWTPAYHDFKRQYGLIMDLLNKSVSLASFRGNLEAVIETGTIRVDRNHRMRLHPTVIEHIKKML